MSVDNSTTSTLCEKPLEIKLFKKTIYLPKLISECCGLLQEKNFKIDSEKQEEIMIEFFEMLLHIHSNEDRDGIDPKPFFEDIFYRIHLLNYFKFNEESQKIILKDLFAKIDCYISVKYDLGTTSNNKKTSNAKIIAYSQIILKNINDQFNMYKLDDKIKSKILHKFINGCWSVYTTINPTECITPNEEYIKKICEFLDIVEPKVFKCMDGSIDFVIDGKMINLDLSYFAGKQKHFKDINKFITSHFLIMQN